MELNKKKLSVYISIFSLLSIVAHLIPNLISKADTELSYGIGYGLGGIFLFLTILISCLFFISSDPNNELQDNQEHKKDNLPVTNDNIESNTLNVEYSSSMSDSSHNLSIAAFNQHTTNTATSFNKNQTRGYARI